MPSKCLVQKFEEIIEDIKIINEFYMENGAEGILEMIQPIKYLIAIISDILNDQTIQDSNNNTRYNSFYNFYRCLQEINGKISTNWDNFDRGLIWIIQRLNSKDFSSILTKNSKEISQFYKPAALMMKKRNFILNCIKELESNIQFKLYQEDLYDYKVRFNIKNEANMIGTSEKECEFEESNKSPTSSDEKEVMTSSFISMEAVDVKLLQERELRDDFSFLNKLKYNSVRFINNLKMTSNLRIIKSNFMISEIDDFESINITIDYEDEDNDSEGLFEMEICPERGLISQNYSCIECGNGISCKDSIKCDFTGNYLCPKCHGGDVGVNPVRIIKNWDFNKYPISRNSKKVIARIAYNCLINFPKLNAKEFKINEKFKNVQIIREKIVKLAEKRQKSAGKTEGPKQMEILQKLAWPKVHLLTSTNLYTIEDLIEIERETFYSNVLLPLYNLLKL